MQQVQENEDNRMLQMKIFSSINVIANQYKKPGKSKVFADVVDSVQMGAWRGAGDLARV